MTSILNKSWFGADIPVFSQAGLRVISANINPKNNPITVTIPGSKSFSNRALVCAGMCSKPLKVMGLLFADDTFWALLCLQRLGFGLTLDRSNASLEITPPSKGERLTEHFVQLANESKADPLYLGLAGTLARFLPAVILNLGKTFSIPDALANKLCLFISGDPKLCGRPLSPLTVALKSLGASPSHESLPMTLSPVDLKGSTEIDGSVSGQFLSGLLLAAAGSGNKIEIQRTQNLVQPDYVRMTVACLRDFGAQIDCDDVLIRFTVESKAKLRPSNQCYVVEADASTACYFITMAVLLGIELTILNLGSSTLQPDLKFVDFLIAIGAQIVVSELTVKVLCNDDRHRKIAQTVSESLPVLFEGGLDVDFSKNSDQALTAGVVSLFCRNPIRVFGASHIRHHESDRIASLVGNFAQLGVCYQEFEDGFASPGGHHKKLIGHWPTHGDHRFAMTGFLLALFNPGLEILNPNCVAKTAPGFFRQMERLGIVFG